MKILLCAVILMLNLFGAEANYFQQNRWNEINAVIASAPVHTLADLIVTVNDTINSYPYAKDVKEEWVGLNAMVARGSGDCEDYAIAKAELIVKISPSVKCFVLAGKGHARLIVVDGSDAYVLDNQNRKVLPLSEVDLSDLKVIALDDIKIVKAMAVKS